MDTRIGSPGMFMPASQTIIHSTLKVSDEKVKLSVGDVMLQMHKAINERNDSQFIFYLPEYFKCIAAEDLKTKKRQCYKMLNSLVMAHMRESLQMMLKSLPIELMNQDDDYQNYPGSALDYVYHAYPVSDDKKSERLNLIDSLCSKGAKVSLDFKVMSIAENEGFKQVDEKAQSIPSTASNKLLSRTMKNIIEDILLNPSAKYPFSNPESAFLNLLKAGIKPGSECLDMALRKPELPYAKMLLDFGAPVGNVSTYINYDCQLSLESVQCYARKKMEVFIAYYEKKIKPYLNDMVKPIYSGRTKIDGFTVLLSFSWFSNGVFFSKEEDEARDFVAKLNDIKVQLQTVCQQAKDTLMQPTSEKTTQSGLEIANKFREILSEELFCRRFVAFIPTKLAFDRYMSLVYPSHKNTMYGDYRDGFFCLDTKTDVNRYSYSEFNTFAEMKRLYSSEDRWFTGFGLECFELEEMQQVNVAKDLKTTPCRNIA